MCRGIIILALAFPACHSTVVFDPPPSEGAGALLFVVSTEDDQLAYATEPDQGTFSPPLPQFANIEPLELHAASYTCTLDQLELDAGRLALSDEPKPPLARPFAINAYDNGAWTAREVTPEENERFDRFPWKSACESGATIELAPSMVFIPEHVRFAVPLIGDDVLLLGAYGGVFVVSNGELARTARTSTLAAIVTRLPNARAAFLKTDGTLFFADSETATKPDEWQRIDARFELPPRPISHVRAAVRPGTTTNELLAVTNASTIEYFDGASWTRLIAHPSEREELGVVWKNENEAAVIGFAGNAGVAMVNIATRTVEVGSVPGVPELCRISAVGYTEALGFVYGTCNLMLIGGRAYPADVGQQVLHLIRLTDTVIFAAAGDGFTIFDAHRPECLQPLYPLDIFLSALTPTPTGLFWIGGVSENRARHLYFNPEQKVRPECSRQ